MGIGIIVCGLNGSGKSTLGKELAGKLGYHFIDIEDLYFDKNDTNYLFADPRSKEEVDRLFMDEIKEHGDFVFAAVRGSYGDKKVQPYQYAVLIDVPKDIRLKRVEGRSLQKFGDRMLPGGDLYDVEKSFFDMVNARSESYVEDWVKTLDCPIIRVDGTRPIEENITRITECLYKKIQ